LIFFTSNAGISETVKQPDGAEQRVLLVKPTDPYEEIEKKVKNALVKKFKPEVLNRIGENVVVFNYISEEATSSILEKQLNGIITQLVRESGGGIVVRIDDDAAAFLLSLCLTEETLEYGGRGIGNVVESNFLNPLAEYIFDHNVQSGSTVHVTRSLLEGALS
jgi:ATP-dependent Clp protease ATP-binding subunit ClpA